jgi:excisionase family DNA binding protein
MATAIPQLLTIVDAARLLGISRSKLYELLADGELPSVRIGRTRRISTSDLEEFVVAHTDREPTRTLVRD